MRAATSEQVDGAGGRPEPGIDGGRGPGGPRGATTLVAAIGHPWLRDLSFGNKVVERILSLGVPSGVDVVDLSFGTIAAFQQMAGHGYRQAIFVSGTPRGRTPGTLHCERLPRALPPDEEIHARVGDCVMGCLSVDNLIVLGWYFGELPREVLLVEAEPADDTWGGELSPEVADLVEPAIQEVLAAAIAADPMTSGEGR